ncbi:hypothetical protein ACFX2B_034296 [Malus domestica]
MADRTYYSGSCTTTKRKEFYSRPLPEDILKLTAQQASFPSTLSSNRLLFILLMLNTSTKDMNFIQLHELVKRKTGGISIDPMTSSVRCKKDPCGHIVVRGEVMAGRDEDLFELIHYILQEVRFTEPEPFKHKVSQFIAEHQDNAGRH